MARSHVELFEQIRRDWRAGGLSIRELADRRWRRSSSGMSRRAKTEMPSSGCPSRDQAGACGSLRVASQLV